VSFRGALTPELLDAAGRRATCAFDRARLAARAEALGVAVSERREDRAARELLAALRAGAPIDPVLVGLLKRELRRLPAAAPPAPLADVAEWVGADERRRGRALRDLLRLSDRVARSRPRRRPRPDAPFPRFRSRRRRPA
jgi:hypothetical protein